jgi:hypothetical protein
VTDRAVLLKTKGPGSGEQMTTVEDDDVSITQNGNSCSAFIKTQNILLSMRWRGFYMDFEMWVPRSTCSNAVGHLGRCDRNRENDVSGFDEREQLAASPETVAI